MNDGWIVVQPRISTHVVQTRSGASLQICGAVDQCSDTGRKQGTRAHDTGLECDDKCAVIETPPTESCRCITKCKHLGVCGRIVGLLAFVVTRSNNVAVMQYNSTHRHVAVVERPTRFVERRSHCNLVVHGGRGGI